MYSTKFLVIAVVIALLVGLAAGWMLSKPKYSEPLETSGETPDEIFLDEIAQEDTIESKVTDNSVTVFDQPAGSTVQVLSVSLIQNGWVVIHEDRDGRPGNILGAQRFTAGLHPEGGEVELLRWTEEGETYYAMLHDDDIDRSFDLTTDLPLTDENGKVILATFVATANVTE